MKINYDEREANETDDDDLFEDEYDPADYSDESFEEDYAFLKKDSQLDFNNNLNDSCQKLRGLSVAEDDDLVHLSPRQNASRDLVVISSQASSIEEYRPSAKKNSIITTCPSAQASSNASRNLVVISSQDSSIEEYRPSVQAKPIESYRPIVEANSIESNRPSVQASSLTTDRPSARGSSITINRLNKLPPVPKFPTPPSSIFPVAPAPPPPPTVSQEMTDTHTSVPFNLHDQPPISHSKEHEKLQQQLQCNQPLEHHSKLSKRHLEASQNSSKPLFSTNQVALLRMSNQIDNLVQTTQALTGIQARPRSSSPLTRSVRRPKTNFRQHLFNCIFMEKCKRAFTPDGVMHHNFEYYVNHMPTEVHSIIGNIIFAINIY